MMNKFLLMSCFFSWTLFLTAAERGEDFEGVRVFDTKILEKELQLKFDIPFPNDRYDIDYFHRNPLAVFKVGEDKVLLSRPFIAGDSLHFSLGAGHDTKSFEMMADAGVYLVKNAKGVVELQEVSFWSAQSEDWSPAINDPRRLKFEKIDEYLLRSQAYWLKRVETSKNAEALRKQIKASYRLIAACFKQEDKKP